MPTFRTGSVAGIGGVRSAMEAAGTFDQSSSRMMSQLYEEREEKRRLLHLMRTAMGPTYTVQAEHLETLPAADKARAPFTSRSTLGRQEEQAAISNGHRYGSADARIRPARDRPQVDRSQARSAAQTLEDTKSSGFGFMMPFEVSLPSFSSAFQSTTDVEPSSKNWLHESPRAQQLPSSRRSLDLLKAAPIALQEQRNVSLTQRQLSSPSRGENVTLRELDSSRRFDPSPQQRRIVSPPRRQDAQMHSRSAVDKEGSSELRPQVKDLEQELQRARDKSDGQDEQIQKMLREREYLVKKCASLSIGLQLPPPEGTAESAVSDSAAALAEVANLQSKLDAALVRWVALEREVQQMKTERDEATRALDGALKERDDAVAWQVQQQKMLLERSANVQAALQASVTTSEKDKAENLQKSQAAQVDQLKHALDEMKQELANANAALAASAQAQELQTAELVITSAALQTVHNAICRGDAAQAALSSTGVGVKLSQQNLVVNGKKATCVVVNEVSESAPSAREVKVGDALLSVDGQSCQGLDSRAVQQLLLGTPGGTVKIRVNRNGKISEPTLKREQAQPNVADAAPKDLERQSAIAAADLYSQIEDLRKQVDEAAGASESVARSVEEDEARLRQQLEEQGTVQKAATKQIEELIDACKAADQKAADASAEIGRVQAAEATKSISCDEAALANSKLQFRLNAADKKFAETDKNLGQSVTRVLDLESELKRKVEAEGQGMLALEEARNAITRMYSAICNQSAQGPIGGIGISLGAGEVSIKGKRKAVVKINGIAPDGPAAGTGLVQVGDVLLEVDGRDISQMDPKAAKELVKGPAGSIVRLKTQRASAPAQEFTMERSSAASSSETGSAMGAATGMVSKEPSVPEKGKEGAEKAAALHEQLSSLMKQLDDARRELRNKVAMQSEMEQHAKQSKQTEAKSAALAKELEASNAKLAETKSKANDLNTLLDQANQKLSMVAKSGDERVVALEKEQREMEDALKTVRSKTEKQLWDLEEAQSALRLMHSAICRQAPATPVGGIGIALGTETVNIKGKQLKFAKVTQIASSGPAAACGVMSGDLLVEIDGRDVTNVDVKTIKEMTKGPPGSPLKLKAKRGVSGPVYKVVLEVCVTVSTEKLQLRNPPKSRNSDLKFWFQI